MTRRIDFTILLALGLRPLSIGPKVRCVAFDETRGLDPGYSRNGSSYTKDLFIV